jgi:hypothetical protein
MNFKFFSFYNIKMPSDYSIKNFVQIAVSAKTGKLLAKSTQKLYFDTLEIIENQFGQSLYDIFINNEKKLYDYFTNLKVSENSKADKRAIIYTYIRTFNLESKVFEKFKETALFKDKTQRSKATKISLIELRNKFKQTKFFSKNEQLLISLLINYDFSFRRDLSDLTFTKNDNRRRNTFRI